MIDIQNMPDERNIDIDRVGIKNVKYPITVRDRANGHQSTVADINMFVDLPRQFKGTHMSRFLETLNIYHGKIDITQFDDMLKYMKRKLRASKAHIEFSFPYFMAKKAPVTKSEGLIDYRCSFKGAVNGDNEIDIVTTIEVPVTTLCPCSKEISRYGAHNQRSIITLSYRSDGFIWLEEMIELAESCASSEIYSLLKREDERYVTEKAYDNPVFVEDVVRAITEKLNSDKRIIWFQVESENFESIHNHSAYAFIERDKRTANQVADLIDVAAGSAAAGVYRR
ncbi:MAG: GTP cyclohydrolase I FolE2 [candidate division Zixibacteria bacterium]|nr:GTP cyclohydrolase I FolE2 [candidate division Zixibacteria bacterium]